MKRKMYTLKLSKECTVHRVNVWTDLIWLVLYQINPHYVYKTLFTSWCDLIFPQTVVIAYSQHPISISNRFRFRFNSIDFNDMLHSFTDEHYNMFTIGYCGTRMSNILNAMLRIAIFIFNNFPNLLK